MARPDHSVTKWRKSTYSGSNGSDCVEVAASTNVVLVRDTKNRTAAPLTIDPSVWARFAMGLK